MRINKGVVALSGGADSATLLYFAAIECEEIHAISIDYGQRHSKELECAVKLCKDLSIPHTIIPFHALADFGGSPLVDKNVDVPLQEDMKQSTTVVPYRNTFIVTLAAAYAHMKNLNTIYIGATYEDLENYADCRPLFFESLRNTVRLGGTIHDLEIRTPFIDSTKKDIIQLGYYKFGIDYSSTWTCYLGENEPCMKCDACRERMESFRLNGLRDPLVPEDKWTEYVLSRSDEEKVNT